MEKRSMMGISEFEEDVIQNLRDAGCSEETIEKFITELKTGREKDGLKRLAAHRKDLLDALHKEQKCIDCLDYLVYQMRKAAK